MVHDDGDGGGPFLEFVHPVGQGTQRSDDEMRAEILFPLSKQCDERYRLDSFA